MSFVSYEFLSHEGYDSKTNEHRWKYKIVDSDEWEAVTVGMSRGNGLAVWGARAVIQEYSKRGLPVAANIIRALQWYSTKYYGYSIEQIAYKGDHNENKSI